MVNSCINFCPWTTVFSLDDSTILLNVTRSKLSTLHRLDEKNLCGRLTCLAGREILLPNSFDLLKAKLFFELEAEIPKMDLRLLASNDGADAFADLYDRLARINIFPTPDLLLGQLLQYSHFSNGLSRNRIRDISVKMIRLWNDMIQFCTQNALGTSTRPNLGQFHDLLQLGDSTWPRQ